MKTKTAPLESKPLVLQSPKLPDTPKPVPWRAFKRFARDAQELLEYVKDMRAIGFGQDDGDRDAGGIIDDAEWLKELVARVGTGFARFDCEQSYQHDEEDGRVLKLSHIAKRLSVLAISFPAGAPGSPQGYLKMLVEHVSAVENLSEVALESACREIVETHKFLPAASEVLTVLEKHNSDWWHRWRAMETAEGARQAAIKTLREREAEREKEEHDRAMKQAIYAAQNAMRTTQRLAQEIEAKRTELAALVQRHAEAEKRESELMRALPNLKPPEEAETVAAAAKSNGSGQPRMM
jgi:hypothetical protein